MFDIEPIHERPDGLLTVGVVSGPEVARLIVKGELDLLTAPEFSEAVCGRVRTGPAEVLLDLRDVGFCGTSGIAALLDIAEACREVGTALALVADHRVRRPLAVLGLDRMFTMVDSVDRALTTLD